MPPPIKSYRHRRIDDLSSFGLTLNQRFATNIFTHHSFKSNSKSKKRKQLVLSELPPIDRHHELLSASNSPLKVYGSDAIDPTSKDSVFESLKQKSHGSTKENTCSQFTASQPSESNTMNDTNTFNFTDANLVCSTPINHKKTGSVALLDWTYQAPEAFKPTMRRRMGNRLHPFSSTEQNEATECVPINNNKDRSSEVPRKNYNLRVQTKANQTGESNDTDISDDSIKPGLKRITAIHNDLQKDSTTNKNTDLMENFESLNSKSQDLIEDVSVISTHPTSNLIPIDNCLDCADGLLNRSKDDYEAMTAKTRESDVVPTLPPPAKCITLRPGKTWRRSLSVQKRASILEGSMCTTGFCKDKAIPNLTLCQQKCISPVRPKYSAKKGAAVDQLRARETGALVKIAEEVSLNRTCLTLGLDAQQEARALVLQRCQQSEPRNFFKSYRHVTQENCRKLGEGVYGEVFQIADQDSMTPTVIKVIPIEGALLVNGERQKRFQEILTEVIVAAELSALYKNEKNMTSTFIQLKRVRCLHGLYLPTFISCWKEYDKDKGSENDCPTIFDRSQMYIAFELEYAGNDLESFDFNDYDEIYHVFMQIAVALAVAEQALQFEHRDLHLGNVLITRVNRDETCENTLKGKPLVLPTHGVRATIIDFTLSRVTYGNVCFYNDLSLDPDLFTADGDYQFDIYREMRKHNGDDWEKFEPYSNILWLHYLLEKMSTVLNVVNRKDQSYLDVLKNWKQKIRNFKSATNFVRKMIARHY